MNRRQFTNAIVAVAFLMGSSCVARVPDLSFAEAAEIVSRAPEFNRYARLVNVERLDHAKDSMDSVTFGKFTFQYLNAPAGAAPIEASVDFRYDEGKWWLNSFDYGCPGDCYIVNVYDGPTKESSERSCSGRNKGLGNWERPSSEGIVSSNPAQRPVAVLRKQMRLHGVKDWGVRLLRDVFWVLLRGWSR